MKNRKNDRSDASLQVDPLDDVRGSRSWNPSSHQEGGYHTSLPPPLGDGERKGEVVLLPQCLQRAHRSFWSSIHAFSYKRIYITWADFMDRAPRRGTKTHSPLCIIFFKKQI